MTGDEYWQMFADTGEPMSWLFYRAADKKPPETSGRDGGDDPPSGSD